MKNNDLSFPTNESLLSDKQLASLIHLSIAWIRKQRWKRRAGQPHTLDIEPVMVGGVPRYRSSDVQSWLNSL